MEIYKLVRDDITIIEIENKNFIIDTGVPFSFCYEKEMDIIVESKTYHLNKSDMLSDVFKKMDIDVEGIIGLDIINKQPGLTIDKENHVFMFSSQSKENSIHKPLSNLCVSAAINGIPAHQVYLDTAAINDIISSDFINGLKRIKTIKQSTALGNIDFDVYNIETNLLNKSRIKEMLILPEELRKQIPFDGIINPHRFYQKYLSFDFKNNEIYFE